MKKLFKKFVNWLYVKTFPERAGKFPIPDLIRVNTRTFSPTTLYARKIYSPYEAPYLNDGVVYNDMIKAFTPELAKYIDLIRIEGGYPLTKDPSYITYEARLLVLNKEADNEQ